MSVMYDQQMQKFVNIVINTDIDANIEYKELIELSKDGKL